MKEDIVIKFDQSVEQTVGEITKIIGLVKPKHLISVIDNLNLEANPRDSKTGPVTKAIQDSISEEPVLFPFKTKGILLASSGYERLQRKRIRIQPNDLNVEGILDGGHNTLAIGMYILRLAMEYVDVRPPRCNVTWDEFKDLWEDNRDIVQDYIDHVRESGPGKGELDFYVPVELLVPRDPDDFESMRTFSNSLLEICAARNNNVQLNVSAKANQHGYFDSMKRELSQHNPEVCSRIEWKTNDGGAINVQDYIALAWMPLSLVDPVHDEKGNEVKPPSPTNMYSGKANGLKIFEKLMSSDEATIPTDSDYKRELSNHEIASAFKLAAELPELYDYVYEKFPELYNASGGSCRNIKAVRALNEKRKSKSTPFTATSVNTLIPDGFITPLFYGMIALMEQREEDGNKAIRWKVDPYDFLDEHLPKIVERYADVLAPWNFDPQKVGKAPQSYNQAFDSFRMALAGIL